MGGRARARARWSRRLALASAVVLTALATGCAGSSPGQETGDGSATGIGGTVYAGEGTGTPLPGIPVQCGSASATSGTVGAYTISGLPAGRHTLTVSAAGYEPYAADVLVTAAATTTHDVHLIPNPSAATIGSSGGTVTSPSGLATLTFPQGTIEGDIEISFTEPAQQQVGCAWPVFETTPADTALSLPGTLTIRYPPGTMPQGAAADDAAIGWVPAAAAPGALAAPPVLLTTTTSAGVASADVYALGRYLLVWVPKCPIEPGGDTIIKTADQCIHWTFDGQSSEGAGSSSVTTSTFGRMMVSAGVPVGSDGGATAQASVGMWFRSTAGRSGRGSTENGDVTVRISHAADVQSDHYRVFIGVDTTAPYRAVVENAQGGNVTAGGTVAFWQEFPVYPAFMLTESHPYQAQSTMVSMSGCHLEAGDLHMVAVHLLAIAQGSPAVDTLPATGGEVSFYPDGLRIDEISVGCDD